MKRMAKSSKGLHKKQEASTNEDGLCKMNFSPVSQHVSVVKSKKHVFVHAGENGPQSEFGEPMKRQFGGRTWSVVFALSTIQHEHREKCHNVSVLLGIE